MHFGQYFQAFLTQKKLSHAQAAALLGWTPPNVTYYCRQENPPRPHVLAHMAAKLGVSEAELLGAEGGAEKQAVVVREAGAVYPAAVDPWPAWGRLLKAAFKRDPARVELAVRAAWPREAEKILDWLRGTG
jgi:transcriptional regulator with XRE-family HTH domain